MKKVSVFSLVCVLFMCCTAEVKSDKKQAEPEMEETSKPTAQVLDLNTHVFPFGLDLTTFEQEKRAPVSMGDCDTKVTLYKKDGSLEVIEEEVDCYDYGTTKENLRLVNGTLVTAHTLKNIVDLSKGDPVRIIEEMIYLNLDNGFYDVYTRADTLAVEATGALKMPFSKGQSAQLSSDSLLKQLNASKLIQ